MSDVESLAIKRADREGNCKNVPPVDILRMALADVESGRVKPSRIVIHFSEPEGPNDSNGFYAAGVTYLEHLGMLEVAKNILLFMSKK